MLVLSATFVRRALYSTAALTVAACVHRPPRVLLRATCPAPTAVRPPLRLALASEPSAPASPAFVIAVLDSTSDAPVADAAVVVMAARDTVRLLTGPDGHAAVPALAARTYRLRIVHIGYEAAVDTVADRAGYMDTVIVGLRRTVPDCAWTPVRDTVGR
jgi:hypothetical protein